MNTPQLKVSKIDQIMEEYNLLKVQLTQLTGSAAKRQRDSERIILRMNSLKGMINTLGTRHMIYKVKVLNKVLYYSDISRIDLESIITIKFPNTFFKIHEIKPGKKRKIPNRG